MKKKLTKWMIALVCVFSVSVAAFADRDKPVNVSQLPAKAQQVLKKSFPKHKVALAKMESEIFDKKYDVIFTNGDKIEFDKNGNWLEISCERTAVPSSLVPAAISKYVSGSYPGTKILKIELDRSEYEVKLNNRLEVTFNSSFQVIDIDD